MKRYLTILFFLIFLAGSGYAQSGQHIYTVKFSDKATTAFSIATPSKFLSAKSIERRLLQKIPLNESDLPINPGYINALLSSGAEVLYKSKWLNLAIISVKSKNIAENLAKETFIKSISPSDYLYTKFSLSGNKSHFDKESVTRHSSRTKAQQLKSTMVFDYGFSLNQVQMIHVDQLHNLGFTGKGITIAIIDAGFNSVNTLAAFDSLRANGQIIGTHDFVQPGNDVYNTSISTHGMMVLSTMGAYLPGQLIGTAPGASFYLLRSEDAPTEYLMEEYYWVNAAEYADSVGVDIINSSLGYTRFDNPAENHTYNDMDGNTTVITIGADMAVAKGILVVNSAGNSGNDDWLYIGAPADGDSVFTIGAVDPEGAYASFSSIGPTFDGRIKPDISAQGVNTIVALIPNGVGGGSGTSFSSPVIAGASACLWQANPAYTNMELIDAIKKSSSQYTNPDNFKGWGIPDYMQANNLLTSSFVQHQESFSGLNVFPIPFRNQINIEIVSENWLIADFKIINSIGRSVAEMNGIELSKGKNMIAFNNLEKLPKGIYMLQISDGYYVVAEKIIK